MAPRLALSLLPPLLLFSGAVWLVVSLSAVPVGALGVTRFHDTRIEGRSFPKVVVNPDGRRQFLRSDPRRVVSLVLGADEILTSMLPPERIVAVSRFADDPVLSTCAGRVPAGAARIRGVDPEHIIRLEPDIVFVASYTLESAVRILVGTGIPVVRLGQYDSYADVAKNVRLAAAAVGTEPQAEVILADMDAKLDAISRRIEGRPRPRVLYYSSGGYTSGSRTLIDEKIHRAGGRNVVAEAGISGPRHLSVDLLATLDPDVIVVPRWAADDSSVRDVRDRAIWKRTTAVRRGRVYGIDTKWLTSVSPDSVSGVEQLAHLLHPEVFSS